MKGDKEIVGTLRGFDDYVNMVLDDVEEYEKFHRRIKGDRMSLILKKPKSFDWVCKGFFSFYDLPRY